MLMGENGIIAESKDANVGTNKAVATEEVSLAWQNVNMEYNQAHIEDRSITREQYFTIEKLNNHLTDKGTIEELNYNSTGTSTIVYKRNKDNSIYNLIVDSNGQITTL